MTISQAGLNQIKKHEGLMLSAYLDAVRAPTIGYGNTFYEDGTKVKLGERITMERAEALLRFTVDRLFSPAVNRLVTKEINQAQFDALVSFTYNLGAGALAQSTLLKKVNSNPCDETIREEFMKWNRAGGRVLKGLTKRREDEADLYFQTDKA